MVSTSFMVDTSSHPSAQLHRCVENSAYPHVGWPPRRLARIMPPSPKHQRRDLLTLADEVLPRRLTGTREISHGLMPFVGYPDCSEFAGARQLGQLHRVATVRLHPNAGLLRDQRGSCHHALVAEASDQPVQPVSGRPSLVAKCQRAVFGRKLGNQFACCRARRIDLPHKADLSATAALGNCYRIPQLRCINSNESFAMITHGSPSLYEALPGLSG